ncbi:GGDEF domain-containing response regulator [Wenzhouxiangella sp. 15181]|nr:GGDEF domain-containing response regulator [Wenzhouxiangella sp. 15181]RFP68191.1 GGDEF domain-containing response regulator [Wenzhouxiangella sp. 15190]
MIGVDPTIIPGATQPVQTTILRVAPVLIVDDTPSKRLAMKAALAPLGHRIVEADSGVAALRRVMEEDFAVILLDVTMPGMDGFETARLIRERWQSEMTPIIFVTAFSSDEVGQIDHYAGGAVDFLFAPIPPTELRSKVSFFAHVFLNAENLAARSRVVQETADRLRSLTDAAPIGIFQTDANNRYVYTNARWSEITGISADEAFGRDWDSIIDTESRAGNEDALADSAALRYRFTIDRGDAGSRVVFATTEAMHDGEGERTGWVGTLSDVTAERQALAAQRFQAQLLGAVGEAVIATDLDGTVRYWNEAAERLYGWSADEVIGRPIADVTVPTGLADDANKLMTAATAGETLSGQFSVLRRDGSTFTALVTNSPIWDEESGALTGIIGVSADITDLTSAQELLARTAAQQTAVAELGRYALAADDIASVARAAETTITGILGPDDWNARVHWLGEPDSAPADAGTGAIVHVDVGDSAVISVWNDQGSPLASDGHHFVSDVASHLDSMLRRAGANVQFEHLATHDPLTELPNRTLFLDRLQQVRNASDRNDHRHAVLFLDLDGFKFVNDGLGHDVGDQLLLAVVERLRSIMRPSDTLARFGGDEFAILCPDIGNEGTALAVGARIQTALDMPFQLKSMELMATASIGIALGDGSTDGGDLLRDADAAMYRAKDGGRNRVALFDEDIQCKAQDHLARAAGLRGALGNGEIFSQYHPIVDLASGRVVGVEALARWRRPSGELVAPDIFIGLAEEIGLIESLGQNILRTACRDALAWTQLTPEPFMLSVNVSPRQFSSGDLANMVLSTLEETGFDARHLLLEITESALMNEPSVQTVIGELRKHGVKFAIDDFGTGYSSLASLRQLPVDFLKIDKSFVSGITTDAQDRALITAAIDLAQSFGLITIAEGVETPEQLRELIALDCDLAQGYLWTQPIEADKVAGVMKNIGKDAHDGPNHAHHSCGLDRVATEGVYLDQTKAFSKIH